MSPQSTRHPKSTTQDVPEVTIEELATGQRPGNLIDVREPDEYAAGHVPGATSLPKAVLTDPDRVAPLHRHEIVFVICRSGNRSRHAARTLRAAGVNAVSVAGGTTAWQRAGRDLA